MEKIQKTGSVSSWFMQNEENAKVEEKVSGHRVDPVVLVIFHEKNRVILPPDWNISMGGDKKTVVIMKNLMYNQQQQVTKPPSKRDGLVLILIIRSGKIS